MDLTAVTATLGRSSLKNLVKMMELQTYTPKWLIIFDGRKALNDGLKYLPKDSNITIVCSERRICAHYPLMFKFANIIDTPYMCVMDDDNGFTPNHCELLYTNLIDSHPYVATNRLYCDNNLEPFAKEHTLSGLVDSNNMAMQTSLWKDVADYYKTTIKRTGNRFSDRHVTSYLLTQGHPCWRIPRYTVYYQVNPKHGSYSNLIGTTIIETLAGKAIGLDGTLNENSEIDKLILAYKKGKNAT